MAAFTLHILKMNLIAAGVILLVSLLARLIKENSASGWKYWTWFAVGVFLLVPVRIPAGNVVRVRIEAPREQESLPGEALPEEGGKPENSITAAGGEAAIKASSPVPVMRVAGGEAGGNFIGYYLLDAFSKIWIAGAVLIALVRILHYHLAMKSLRRWSCPVDEEKTLMIYRRICRKLQIRRPPKLWMGTRLSTPVLAGIKRTGLYLTQQEYSREELRFIFSHELTHFRRRDLWYKMFLMAVNTIYWFNPVLYWMRREADRTVENLCDGWVVKDYSAGERIRYGKLLLKTASFQSGVPYMTTGFNNTVLVFKERIRYICGINGKKERYLPAVALVAAMLAAQVMIGSAVGMAAAPETASAADLEQPVVPVWDREQEETPDTANRGTLVEALRVSDGNGMTESAVPGGTADDREESAGDHSASGDMNDSQTEPQEDGSAQGTGSLGETDGAGDTVGPDYAIVPEAFTGWIVTDQLNVRSSYTLDSAVIRTAYYADTLSITGVVTADGQDTGWYQIDDGGVTGYVSAQYVSVSPPTAEKSGIELTDDQVTLYSEEGMGANYVYRSEDGGWYDGSGRQYTEDSDGQWMEQSSGSAWAQTDPPSPEDSASASASVVDLEGMNHQILYLDGGTGIWQNGAGGVYTDNGDGTYTGPDGTVWYLE